MGAHTLVDARQNPASPTDHISSPSGIRTREVDVTIRPAGPGYCDVSGGHSTGIETMGTGTGTGNLRQRAAYLDPPVPRDFVSLNQQPEVQEAMKGLVIAIRASPFLINNMMEPLFGSLEAAALLMAVAPDELWSGYGKKGKSIYTLFIEVDGAKCKCLWCDDVQTGKLWRAIDHVRAKHLGHEPFLCGDIHADDEVW
jgi:hypothetical protein